MRKFLCLVSAALTFAAIGEIPIKNGDTIVWLGDSITANANNGFIPMVTIALEMEGIRVKSLPRGVAGQTSKHMLARLGYGVLSNKPQWLTLSCGVNDVGYGKAGVSLEDFKKYVCEILDTCAASNATVIIMTPTPHGENLDNENNRKLDGYVTWLKAEGARRKLPVADLNTAFKSELRRLGRGNRDNDPVLTADNLHPNFKGNIVMAYGILEAIGYPLDDKRRAELKRRWRKIPYVHRVALWLNDEEYEQLHNFAVMHGWEKSQGPLEKWIRDFILSRDLENCPAAK